ncbi:hypothetical protein [Methylobacter sp.]|uniref:hypothetical protein n=1 Tax=Methylobacter sp. TaxID=2051955 RepID=UPI002FDE5253
MHVIISIDDQENGEISVKTLVHPAWLTGEYKETPATELGDFLQAAIDAWRDTLHMDKQQLQLYLQAMTSSAPQHH